ncbi:hypothetical protein [Desulfatitalea alkaliphila]|uniref:DUF4157 domain-containing protein n=1 Tax=Desulfatitalea alkaliphila TaxID=2929485 RepID=A0AA41QXY1_9BACT|nr:hypothetical protein [Desulfatitalea alkaliphila]MCJ8498977.1 hypothetical protein [Desulfatitalea alkaliphila]
MVETFKKHYPFALVVLMAWSLLLPAAIAEAPSEEAAVLAWTLRQMGIGAAVALPPVHRVSKDELATVFVRSNRRAYLRWENQYGPDRARMILRGYMDDILGLYDTRTGTVYVGRFLDPCRGQAILAHEFTHHIQHTLRGSIIDIGDGSATILYWRREREAERVEQAYLNAFCGPAPNP